MMAQVDTSNSARRATEGKRLALVIGVNSAPGYRNSVLLHAANSTVAMAEVLHQNCRFELLQSPLLNEQATSENVKKAILDLAWNRGDDDFLLLYFCGHGQPMIIEAQRRDVYLVTHNFRESEVEQDKSLHFSMRWLRDKLYVPTQAGRMLLILDCCYAGDFGEMAPDPYLVDLQDRIYYYFGAPSKDSGARSGGLRWVLASTGPNAESYEKDGYGLMTGLLLPALRGEVDDVIEEQGDVSIQGLHRYLENSMPRKQQPSLSGNSASRDCILARYPERAIELRRKRNHTIVDKRPRNYIPSYHNPLFQERPGEFERLEKSLFGSRADRNQPVRLGLIAFTGQAGVGKTQLAAELAYRYQDRFPGGIFWMSATGKDSFDWQHQFAEMALLTDYLPFDDDPSRVENERQRALHFCRYLVDRSDALLIFDNVEEPDLVASVLPTLAGKEPACTVLYTSRNQSIPRGVKSHTVEQLPERAALRLLLETTRPVVLDKIEEGRTDQETQAAHAICQYVGYLPLALEHLRKLLEHDQHMRLAYLNDVLRQRGPLGVIKALSRAFRLSWEYVQDERAQRLFKLACYFPEAAPIPLWLLGLASGLGESGAIIDPLGEACDQLDQFNFLKVLSRDQVRLHPLVRDFGLHLVEEDHDKGKTMLEEAGKHLMSELADLNRLEQRALKMGYWQCLERVQAARAYIELLGVSQKVRLAEVERWLDHESYLLGDTRWWPDRIQGLFYQQLFNRSIEAGHLTPDGELPERWLRQEFPVGAEDPSLVRRFAGHIGPVLSVAFSPDGSQVLTGSDDGTVLLWEANSGRVLARLEGHKGSVWSAAFSFDGLLILTGSEDRIARLWDTERGRELLRLEGHTSFVTCVTFSPDASKALTGSKDGTARIWDLKSGKELGRLEGHISLINSVSFSPDGRRALTGSADGTIRLWNVETHKELNRLEGHTNEVRSVTFSPGGSQVLSGSDDKTARLWDVATGSEVQCLEGHSNEVSSVAFSADGRWILTGSWDRTVRVWMVGEWREVARLEGLRGNVRSIAFSPDGKYVLAGSDDSTAQMWEWKAGSR